MLCRGHMSDPVVLLSLVVIRTCTVHVYTPFPCYVPALHMPT